MSLVAEHVNKFPIIQIFQDYSSNQEIYRVNDAKGIDFYLMARKIIEEIFKNTDLTPDSWENYRSLFYTQYQGKSYQRVRK